VVEIARGGARFVVSRNPQRVFRVEAGDVAVEVLGTRFSVYREAGRARVDVEEGRVLVRWAGGSSERRSGESGLFPPERLPPAKATNGSLEVPRRAQRSVGAPAPTWRDLAQEGDFDKAYEALARRGAPTVRDEPAELLLAADVARLSHHSGEAVAPLERLLTDHAADPRAPLAAFTLGRVLLEELGQPLQAARAFARAERLAPDGPLAQDAIAREVEAWSRAGDAFAARTRAEEYVKRYPDGRRLRAVRRFGGLE